MCGGFIRDVAERMFCNAEKSSVNHVGEVVPDHACEMISYPPIGSSTSSTLFPATKVEFTFR